MNTNSDGYGTSAYAARSHSGAYEAASRASALASDEEAANSIRLGFESARGSEVVAAAVAISDAVSGLDRQQPLVRHASQRAFLWELALDGPALAAVVGLVALTFWEAPRWCRGATASRCRCVWDPERPTACPYPTYDVSYVDERVAALLQVGAVVVVAAHVLANRVAVGAARFWTRRGRGWVACVCALAALDVARCVGVVLGRDAWEMVVWRPAPYLRLALLVAYSSDIRSQLRLVLKILPAFLRISALVGLLLSFTAWFGVVIYPPRGSAEGRLVFPNFREAAWQLVVCLTTANFPDVMLPAYDRGRWTATVFFGGFLTLGTFFMMNLLLATVYNTYQEEQAAALKSAEETRARHVDDAFALLADAAARPPVVRPEKLAALFGQLNSHRDVAHVSEAAAGRLFVALDARADGAIHADEFKKVVDALAAEANKPWTADALPRARWRVLVRRVVTTRGFELAVDALLVANAIVVAIQTRDQLEGRKNPDVLGGPWEAVETGLAFVYVLELALKIAGLGWRRYVSSLRNCFDGAVTAACVVAAAYVAFPNSYSNTDLIHVAVMLRLLRLVRLVVALPEFQVLGESFVQMIPAATKLLKALFCCCFFFAAVGAALFQERINTDPAGPDFAKLQGTDYYASDYLALNFNDYESAFVTLFCILVVNNWFVVVDGFAAVTDRDLARGFFVAFYGVGVLLFLNIVVAFILDAFLGEYTKAREKSLKRRTSWIF